MSVLSFKKVEITDREQAMKLLHESNFRGCDYTFGNSFVWSGIYSIEHCFAEGFYFRRYSIEGETAFTFPAGKGDIRTAVSLMEEYCKEIGIPLRITANKDITEKLREEYPDAGIEFNRDISDYVYLAEDLEELKGKKYHAKRNHLNRFYENDWSFEPLTADNIEECRAMNKLWREENIDECCHCSETESKLDELCVVEISLDHFDELGYVGGVLRVNGEVQAFTFGEPSSDDCFVVHVEKALRKYQGAYTAINREFVKSLGGRYKYINREEDTGAEGLRKAKLSYNPIFLEEKYNITFGGTL
ncbi:MAG: phosphatidylglycerol lysyltransferase domain-containing protein [Oscillospiraceae bacterium]|nr:phosphatidylglycerol lysyltransferase domain-containing protein [Oscillospiraceae bacterium]